MKEFDNLVNHLIATGELGYYNPEKYSICLYDIRNTPEVVKDLNERISALVKSYKLIILSPKEDFTNMNLLDIGL